MISPAWDTLILAVVGFISGSIPFGYLAARARGVDIRKVGSGNVGATNAMRALGTGWGVAVGVLDALKGAVPVWVALIFSPLPGIVGAAAIAGHVFSPWLGFRGGKGVATTLGVFLVLAPAPTLAVLFIWIILFLCTGYVSVASVFSLAGLPFALLVASGCKPELSVVGASVGTAMLVVWTHRGNLLRLAWGKEPRAGLWKRMWKR